jgi:hypothetical protein
MSDRVIRSLADEIRHSHFFALLADETTDVSNRQQLVVCIRWIDDGIQAHEDFIGLYKIDNTKASTIAESCNSWIAFKYFKLQRSCRQWQGENLECKQ